MAIFGDKVESSSPENPDGWVPLGRWSDRSDPDPGSGHDDVCFVAKSGATSGGRSGKHGVVTDASSVTTLSPVGLQVFGHSHGRWFTYIPGETARLKARPFALLHSYSFLPPLHSSVQSNRTHKDIQKFDPRQRRREPQKTSGYTIVAFRRK